MIEVCYIAGNIDGSVARGTADDPDKRDQKA
jgi:hypothetical protein